MEGAAIQWSGDEWYGGNWSFVTGGAEIVYNFAKLERATFNFYGNYTSDNYPAGWSYSEYVGGAGGFRSWWSTVDDYQGTAYSSSLGIGTNLIGELGFGVGSLNFSSPPNIQGIGFYVSIA